MRRIDLVRQAVDEQLSDTYDLLAMRLIHPPPGVEVDIQKEIDDLYVYPERLQASYRDEWRSIAIRALFEHGFPDHWRSDEENLQRSLAELREQAIPRCIHNHHRLFRRLGEVLEIQASENTVVFPAPRRRALMKLIWPENGG